ncbi:MAG: pyruvate formate lyase family protein [Dehalococcoidales bacterium]|nr:pyruvate formate lyase family protein [Dehalococcoidales bacterium]
MVLAKEIKARPSLAEMKGRSCYQSKVMRGMGRMGSLDNKRLPYRSDVKLEVERARLITESYKQTDGEPFIMRRAKALAHLLDNKKLYILSDELIVGNICSKPGNILTFPELWWSWLDKAIDKEYAKIIEDDARKELHEIHAYWRNKAVHGMERNLLPDSVKDYWRYDNHGVFQWIHGGHVGVPNYEKALSLGLNGLVEEIKGKLAEISDEQYILTRPQEYLERKRFYDAAMITLEALVRFGKRFAQKAREDAENETSEQRKSELLKIAEICDWIPGNPARTLHEALQAYWFINLMVRVLDLQSSGLGERFDQLFYPFFQRDLDNGILTREEAVDLVGNLFLKMDEEPELKPPATGAGGATLITRVTTVGGQTPAGEDATNEMTYIVMDAKNQTGLIQPAVAVRLHRKSPAKLYDKITESLLKEPGVYSFFNDEMMIPYLMNLGIPLEDARNYSTDGCMRWNIPGKAMAFRALGGQFVLPKCLDYALHQGVDMFNGKKWGVATPDPRTFKSIDDVIDAYLAQVKFFFGKLVTTYNIVDILDQEYLPQPFLSSLLDGCIEKGQDCRIYKYFLNTIFQPIGQITVANSLAAIKKLVFDEKKVTMEELVTALKNNWEGKNDLRQMFINAPKFGNDDDYVDVIARDMQNKATQTFHSFKNIWGGPFMEDGTGGASYFAWSGLTWATPDGRKSADMFNDGTISPALGTDKKGPTAVLNSVGKIDHIGTFTHLFNQKFLPMYLSGEYKQKFIAYFKTWMDLKIHHIQFNIIDRETLLDAQANPDKYSTLVVRQAGLAAYFVDLEKSVQDEIIARTEQTFD